jgi:hypothetical protein
MDEHRVAGEITGDLYGQGPAIRCTNGPLHGCPWDVSSGSRRL